MNQEKVLNPPSVLVVDDNVKNLQILCGFLQNEGMMVEFALDGMSALSWLEKKKFDLILLDIMMPGMDGFEVCSFIKKNPANNEIPIIFITANTDSESIIKGFETGAVDYITKPFIKSELLIRVKTQIEIKKSRDEIARNLKEIEYKNKLITYSIQYAKTIQTAVLKASQSGLILFPEQFCLILPKDIVSGDFYWFHRIDNKLLVGVFDCTGHGIPGAFMSILGVTLLNETVIREKIVEPHLILNRLREKIIEALGQKGIYLEVKDGMDGSIISYDLTNKTLVYSGAFNPMYLIRDNGIIELKGDRMPLSYHDKMSDFACQEIKTEPNDLIYLFTDGYMDQFSGQNLKKFGSTNFKELLIRHHKKPLEVQKQMLLDAFLNWRGSEEQIDDITIVGLKL
ncbi:MAG: response regulator [Bacteroidales bacterium]